MKLEVKKGLVGKPDISIIADTKTWLYFLAKEKNLLQTGYPSTNHKIDIIF